MENKCENFEEKEYNNRSIEKCKVLNDIVCCEGIKARCWVDERSTEEKLEEIKTNNDSRQLRMIKRDC